MMIGIDPLPRTLRAWGETRHLPTFKGQTRVAWRLAQRSLDPDLAYPTPHGFALRVDPEDFFQVAMLLGFYEPRVTRLVTEYVREGDVAVDVGHAIGYFSLLMSGRTGPAGEVHAFDPDPRAHERLLEHRALNERPWIAVNRVAIGDRTGTVRFGIHDRLGWSSTKQEIKEFARVESVPAQRFDEYAGEQRIDPERIGLIKVDAEGAELEVLRGMRGVLENANPAVVVELIPHRPGERPQEVMRFMTGLGYRPDAPTGDVVFTKS
jgi:FkbM family methyltransferase